MGKKVRFYHNRNIEEVTLVLCPVHTVYLYGREYRCLVSEALSNEQALRAAAPALSRKLSGREDALFEALKGCGVGCDEISCFLHSVLSRPDLSVLRTLWNACYPEDTFTMKVLEAVFKKRFWSYVFGFTR